MKKRLTFLLLISLSIIIGVLNMANFSDLIKSKNVNSLIHGFNLMAPRDRFPSDSLASIQKLGANWIAVVPYAFCDPEKGTVVYGNGRQWWGESPEGIRTTIQMAHSLGLKVMLKPHLWVRGQGWAGDMDYENDQLWKFWEAEYRKYLATYTKIAQEENVALFCIGTEIRHSSKYRNDFWLDIIAQIKDDYKGELTYAANWDEYEEVQFWSELDYIGVDAYFPISVEKSPSSQELSKGWEIPIFNMKSVSKKYRKPIIFTEYGYESIDYPAIGHWNVDKDSLAVNYQAQRTAFNALFDNFKNQEWWAGGFIWKWHLNNLDRKGLDKAYTPQNKPALEVISTYFKSDI